MKGLLGDEYEDWLASYEKPPVSGLRLNNLKVDNEHFVTLTGWAVRRVPWTDNRYYLEAGEHPAKDPLHHAGLYYLQEPSAMTPAVLLPVRPGSRVLDLCAAPGGKSTELGARLQGKGLLISNDVSSSRAAALLKNLERFGIANSCVTAEEPERLAAVFGEFFDSILVDAPCSGEGMFRRDPSLVSAWMERGPEYYAPLQRRILAGAAAMLRPGGFLLYSTCTFSVCENEDNVRWLLQKFPDLTLVPLPLETVPGAVRGAYDLPVLRLFPHRLEGEGHFIALFQKKDRQTGAEEAYAGGSGVPDIPAQIICETGKFLQDSDFSAWERCLEKPFDHSRLMIKDERLYYLPDDFSTGWKLRYLRTGLLLGSCKNKRFEPSQAVAMALTVKGFSNVLCLRQEDERVLRYLKGESIALEDGEVLSNGWILVCLEEFPLGWVKYAGGLLKNKYYPGWRWQ